MSIKKQKKDSTTGGRVIDFDALLGNWPRIKLGDQTIEGRHVNQTEKARWVDAERADDAAAQRAFVVDALNARGATVDDAWVAQFPDAFLVALIRGLFGHGWPGEEAGVEGK